jgi:hypothetical protein
VRDKLLAAGYYLPKPTDFCSVSNDLIYVDVCSDFTLRNKIGEIALGTKGPPSIYPVAYALRTANNYGKGSTHRIERLFYYACTFSYLPSMIMKSRVETAVVPEWLKIAGNYFAGLLVYSGEKLGYPKDWQGETNYLYMPSIEDIKQAR